MYLGAAKKNFPAAKLPGPAMTAAKKPELKFDLILGGTDPLPWS